MIQFPSLFNRFAELGFDQQHYQLVDLNAKKKTISILRFQVIKWNTSIKQNLSLQLKSNPLTGRNEVSSLAFISCRVKSFSHCCQCLVPWDASMGPKMSGSFVYVVDSSLGFVFLQMFFLHGFPLHCHTIGNLRSGRKRNNTK